MPTALWTDPRYEAHVAGPMHPESPGRLKAIRDVLARAPITNVTHRTPRAATKEELIGVHDAAHVELVLSLAGQTAQLDPDTATSPGSTEASLLAAGAAVEATLEVLHGRVENAFALVRPPGHHAEHDRAMGFCLFNNVAVAAETARRAGAERVLVLDWDVHHGNGTQHTFASRRDVLFCSSHQWPYYPGTGAAEEVGDGAGRGFTVNVPLPGGQGDADYGAVFHDVFLPIARRFRPDLILVSAGFDSHRADPIGGMNVTERGFAAMTTVMKQLAVETCSGRLVLLLEGGYDLDGLSQSVHACVEVLAGQRRDDFPSGASVATTRAIEAALEAQRPFWNDLR